METAKSPYRAVTRQIEVKVAARFPAGALLTGKRILLLGLYHHAHEFGGRNRPAQDEALGALRMGKAALQEVLGDQDVSAT
jgi:hypothetical protein